jgi:hypothetical protein
MRRDVDLGELNADSERQFKSRRLVVLIADYSLDLQGLFELQDEDISPLQFMAYLSFHRGEVDFWI